VPLIYQLIDSFEHRAKAWAGRLSTQGA
jgi:hypothetical protein